jgi:hypothetical protein
MATVDKDFKVKNSVTAGIGYRVRSTANPAAPTVALAGLGAGNVDNGTHYYFVTYVTANGETNLSSGASVTVADKTVNGQVTVTIPTSSDTRVTARKIYRNTANSNSWVEVKLLATINDNTTTTYTDNIADASTSWPPTGANTSYYYKDNTTTKPLKDETGNYPLLHATAMNTAVGRNSLATIVAGTSVGGSNNAFGKDTLYSLTTGAQNNVFGTGSGALITTGNDNVLMGHSAGAGLTTGNYNIFLGRNTGYGVATSGQNVFIGYYAGYGPGTTNQNPASNIAIGSSSLQKITTANNNVAIGVQSGYNVTTGGTNTALGTYALYTNSTGTGNVAVGYYAGAYETGTGYFYVNNQDRTNLAGDQTKSLLYGTFNATASSQQLTVNGTLNATYPLVGADTTDSSSTVTGAFKTAGGMGIAKTLYVGTGANIAGGKTTLAATTTGYASLNLPHGTAPSAPVDGDFWTTTAGAYVRVNGVTVGPLASSAGAGVAWGAITGTLSSQTDLQTALNAKLNLSGGTLTGDLTISKASPALTLDTAAAGQTGIVYFKTNTSERWRIIKTATAEGGSDAGSNFAINRYSDAGAFLATALEITRSSGLMTLTGDLTISKAAANLTLSSTDNAYIFLQAATGNAAGVDIRTGTSRRWIFAKTSATESGSNAGSNFVLQAYDDAGSVLNTPFSVTRSTGAITTLALTTTGDFLVSKASPYLSMTSSSGHARQVFSRPAGSAIYQYYQTAGSTRWIGGVTADTESGSNAGSNYFLTSYDDSGVMITNILNIQRSNGLVTLAGDLSVVKASPNFKVTASSGTPAISIDSPSNAYDAYLNFRTGTSARWSWSKSGSETGTNAGSNLSLYAYDDAGSLLSTPLSITRSTGNATFSGSVSVSALTATGANGITVNGGLTYLQPGSNASNALWIRGKASQGSSLVLFQDSAGTTLSSIGALGEFRTPASTTTAAGLRLPHGSAPSAPTDGDIWSTTTSLYTQINGATYDVLAGTRASDAMDEPLGIEDAANVSTTIVNATRVVTVAPVSGSFTYWYKGTRVSVGSAKTVTLDNTTGTWFVYFNDATGTLVKSLTPWSILNDVPVAAIYWDASKGESVIWNERHGIIMDSATHLRLHSVDGTKVISGFNATGYVLQSDADADKNIEFSEGILADEDLRTTIAATNGTTYRVWYRTGASGDWTWDTTTLPFVHTAAGYVNYNQYTGGAWQKTQTTNGDYINYYIVATPALSPIEHGIIVIPGQTKYTSLADAQQENIANLSFGTLPFQEMASLYRVTFRMNSGYTSTGKSRIEALTRIVGSGVSITASGVNAHSGLSGLTDPNAHPASSISVSTASFGGSVLTSSESTVQLALDRIDDYVAPLASPTFTGTVTLPSTTSIGNVSSTELGYVDGVTSSIQTQLNAKAPSTSAFLQDPTLNASVGGTSGIKIQADSGLPSLVFEGSPYDITLVIPNLPTAARTVALPDATGTIALTNETSLTSLVNINSGTSTTTTNIAYGATTSGQTKTVNIGTAGLASSTTNINIGPIASPVANTYAIKIGQVDSVTFPSVYVSTTNDSVAITRLYANGTARFGSTINLNSIGAPGAPADGDIWNEGSSVKYRAAGPSTTKTFAFLESPSFTTPTLGIATATSINKVAITAPATSATLTIADGKTLTASNTLTFTGTDSSSVAFGTGGTVAYTNVATLSSLSSVGTITTGTWQGTAINATYIDSAIARLASPTFTGTVTTPGVKRNVVTKSALYTLTTSDHIVIATSGTWTATLPTAASIAGTEYIIKNSGSGIITVDPAGTETIDGYAAIDLEQYDSLTVVSDGTNWVII